MTAAIRLAVCLVSALAVDAGLVGLVAAPILGRYGWALPSFAAIVLGIAGMACSLRFYPALGGLGHE